MKEIMKYSPGPIPWSMALANGSLVKTVKSKLLDVVEKGGDFKMDCLPGKVLIYDGMVLLQQLGSIPIETFGDVSDHLLNRMLKHSAGSVYFVTDRYIPNTIKSIERSKRSSSGTIRISIERRSQKLPKQFKKYMALDQNKIDLIEFLLKDWSHPSRFKQILGSVNLFVNCSEQFFKLKVDGEILVPLPIVLA